MRGRVNIPSNGCIQSKTRGLRTEPGETTVQGEREKERRKERERNPKVHCNGKPGERGSK